MIPSEQAAGGAKKGEIFPAGAEFFVGVRKVGHYENVMEEVDSNNVGSLPKWSGEWVGIFIWDHHRI